MPPIGAAAARRCVRARARVRLLPFRVCALRPCSVKFMREKERGREVREQVCPPPPRALPEGAPSFSHAFTTKPPTTTTKPLPQGPVYHQPSTFHQAMPNTPHVSRWRTPMIAPNLNTSGSDM